MVKNALNTLKYNNVFFFTAVVQLLMLHDMKEFFNISYGFLKVECQRRNLNYRVVFEWSSQKVLWRFQAKQTSELNVHWFFPRPLRKYLFLRDFLHQANRLKTNIYSDNTT